AEVRVDPDADVHLAADEFTEHHPDLLAALDRAEPGRLFGVDATQRRANLLVEAGRGRAGSVSRGAYVRGAGHEDVQFIGRRKGPQFEGVARAGGPFLQREAQLAVEVVELGGDLPARLLGDLRERQPDDSLGRGARGAEQIRDGVDRGVAVLGVDDDV